MVAHFRLKRPKFSRRKIRRIGNDQVKLPGYPIRYRLRKDICLVKRDAKIKVRTVGTGYQQGVSACVAGLNYGIRTGVLDGQGHASTTRANIQDPRPSHALQLGEGSSNNLFGFRTRD